MNANEDTQSDANSVDEARSEPHYYSEFTTRAGSKACARCCAAKNHPIHIMPVAEALSVIDSRKGKPHEDDWEAIEAAEALAKHIRDYCSCCKLTGRA